MAILIDIDDQMSSRDVAEVRAALERFIGALDLNERTRNKVALVLASDPPVTLSRLSNDEAMLRRVIKRIDLDEQQNLGEGIRVAREVLTSDRVQCNQPDAWNSLIVISSGIPARDCAPIAREAKKLRSNNITTLVVCAQKPCRETQCLQQKIASWSNLFYPSTSGLDRIRGRYVYVRGGADFDIKFKKYSVVENLADNVQYVRGSANPPANLSADGRQLIWYEDGAFPRSGLRLSYQVKPTAGGQVAVSEGAELYWHDNLNQPGHQIFEPTSILVVGGRVEGDAR